jgi:hypothetical protein
MSKSKEMKKSAGTKHDAGKLRLDLLDPEFLTGVADVLGYGAEKYAEHNWLKGIHWTRLYGAILRHLQSAMYESFLDSESGLPHLDHAACMLMFLRRHMISPDLENMDDRCEAFVLEDYHEM